MALKFQGGQAKPVADEDGSQKGIRLSTSLYENNLIQWEGDEQTIARYAQKLTSAGYKVITRRGFKNLYELQVDVSSILRKALGPIGAIPLTPSLQYSKG